MNIQSLLETMFQSGMVIGPAVGGALYGLGGFPTPFVTVGIVSMIVGFMIFTVIESQNGEFLTCDQNNTLTQMYLYSASTAADETDATNVKRMTFTDIVISPGILIFMNGIFVYVATLAYFESTLAITLIPFKLAPFEVAGMFLISAAVQLTCSQISSRIITRIGREVEFTIGGMILMMISLVISGPMWPIRADNTIPMVIMRQIIFGVGSGALMTSTFAGGKKEMEGYGFTSDEQNNSIFAAAFAAMTSLGCVRCGIIIQCS
jgi:hypothetical protein